MVHGKLCQNTLVSMSKIFRTFYDLPPLPPTPPPSFPLVTKYPYFFIKQSKPEDLSGLLPSLWINIKIKGTRQTYTTVLYESAN